MITIKRIDRNGHHTSKRINFKGIELLFKVLDKVSQYSFPSKQLR